MTSAATSEGALVRRFEAPTRVVHWTLALPFVLLMLTGLTNFAPELKAAQVAGVRVFAWLHVVVGFAWVAALVLVAVPQLLRRSARQDLEALTTLRVDDYLWFQHAVLTAAGERSVPPRVGKFNAGQKLNGLASIAVTLALVVTGVILGVNYTSKAVFSADFVTQVFPLHTIASLAFIPLLLGHLYLALLHPSTRTSLRGMTSGDVPRAWAERHHPAWVEQIDRGGPSSAPAPAEAAPTARGVTPR